MSLSWKARRMSWPMNHRALLSVGAMFLLAQIVLAEDQLSFDGVDDRVMVPYDSSFPTETFTIGAWIKLLTPTGRAAIIARGEDDNSFNLSWQLYVSPGGLLEIMLEDQNENNHCYPNTCFGQPQPACVAGDRFVADDEWHHVAGTRDASGELVLYIDGQVVTTCQQTGVPSSNNFQFITIGCTHGTIGPPPGGMEPPTWFLAGLIDEPAMWNAALTGAEIEDVYLNGVNPASPGLVGYWSFDEGLGQVVGDLSPAGNVGFLGANSDPGGDDSDPTWVSCDGPGDGGGIGNACESVEPPAPPPTTTGCCGNGTDGMMIMPMTLLSMGWMRRRRTCARIGISRTRRAS